MEWRYCGRAPMGVDQWNVLCEQSGRQRFDVGKCCGRMFGCVEMLGLWSNHRDLEPMLEWDCVLPPPLLPPALL